MQVCSMLAYKYNDAQKSLNHFNGNNLDYTKRGEARAMESGILKQGARTLGLSR